MKYIPEEVSVVFQELPGELSLTFSITGCGRSCVGCHSPHLQDARNGETLTTEKFLNHCKQYEGFVTNILFFGGEWEESSLLELLNIAKQKNFKTTLYTAESDISTTLKEKLDYLKTGPYIESLGGLSSEATNQKVVDLNTKEDITYKYHSKLNIREKE